MVKENRKQGEERAGGKEQTSLGKSLSLLFFYFLVFREVLPLYHTIQYKIQYQYVIT